MPSALLTPPPPSAIPAPSSRAQLAPSPEHTPGGSIPGRGEGGGRGRGGYRSNRHPCATSHPTAQRASIGRTPLNAPVHPPARMTRAPRTPPPGATGANLSALQYLTHTSTHTHGRQATSGPHTHAQPHHHEHEHHEQRQPATKTITTSTSHHDHEAPTQEDTSTNRSSTNSAQCSDQRKHQTSRWRNNHQPKNLPQTPQRVPRGAAPADRTRD